MKKKLIVALCLTFGILGSVYYFNIFKSVKIIDLHANYVTYNSENSMYQAADIILYGKPTEKFDDRNHINNYTQNESLGDFYTLTKFEVNEVLKKPDNLNISKSDIFEVIEPIGVVQEVDGKKILKPESYEPLEFGEKYIIYLKSNEKGGYSIINMNNGKFNILKTEQQEDEEHKKLKKDIVDKYSKEINN